MLWKGGDLERYVGGKLTGLGDWMYVKDKKREL